MDAYDFVQDRRDEARKLWEKGDSRGIELLQETLRYLQQPLWSPISPPATSTWQHDRSISISTWLKCDSNFLVEVAIKLSGLEECNDSRHRAL